MTTAERVLEPHDQHAEKGLKAGALGLMSAVVIGVASTAPAYSLAATLALVCGTMAGEPLPGLTAVLAAQILVGMPRPPSSGCVPRPAHGTSRS